MFKTQLFPFPYVLPSHGGNGNESAKPESSGKSQGIL